MRIWITGATGLIGSALLPLLVRDGHEVVCLGRRPPWMSNSVTWRYWEAEEFNFKRSAIELPNALIHLASQTSSHVARRNIARDIAINVQGPVQLVEEMIKCGRRITVLTAGSFTENQVDLNVGVNLLATYYEIGKTSLNLYLSQLQLEGQIRLVNLRLSNVYGGSRSSNHDRGFLDQLISMALDGKPLEFFSDADYIRDYIHVSDVAEAFRAALVHSVDLPGSSFEIGSGIGTPIATAVEKVARSVGMLTHTSPVSLIPITPPDSLPPIERWDRVSTPNPFEAATGWKCQVDLDRGLRLAIDSKLGRV